MALIAAALAIGLTASWSWARQGFGGRAPAADPAQAQADFDPMAAARGPHQMLRNGKDYLGYREYEKALEFLRQAEAREAELTANQRRELHKAIAAAQRGLREPAVADARRGPRPGAIALAQPADAPRPAAPEVDREPIQLASATLTDLSTAPDPAVGTAEPDPTPAPDAGTPPAQAPATATATATATDTPAVAPSGPATPPEPLVPPREAATAGPKADDGPLPPLPAVAAEPAPRPSPAAPAPTPSDLPPLPADPPATAPEPKVAPPAEAPAPEPAPLTPAAAPEPAPTPAPEPVAVPVPEPAPVAAPAQIEEPRPAPVAVEATAGTAPEIAPAIAPSRELDDGPPAPPAEEVRPEPAPSPATNPALRAAPDPAARIAPIVVPGPEDRVARPRTSTRAVSTYRSTISPESRALVDRVARLQDQDREGNRIPAPTLPGGMAQPTQGPPDPTGTHLELPRAPSPTEARPIRPIQLPEEFTTLGPRTWNPGRKLWVAAATCHMPLYFQDAVLERYGQSIEQGLGPAGRFVTYPLDDPRQSKARNQIAQPFVSLGLFCFQVAALPYNLVVDPPWEAEYDLGYYRPGDPIPPDTAYLPWLGVGPLFRTRY
jgi:hypothetical protein